MSEPMMAREAARGSKRAWYTEFRTPLTSTPSPLDALAWGSQSMTSTRRSMAAREAARFTVVVVLPTPPF
ncbi:hypothetical protein DSECCO2_588490 [anaerobic digester metagenome]